MTLDINDIQGNIIKAYGHFKLPTARYVFFEVVDPDEGRNFLQALMPFITRAGSWDDLNPGTVTTNLAFTYRGLDALGLPRESLASFPSEFSDGMKARKDILGDDGPSAPENWDPVWQDEDRVHIWLSINGRQLSDIESRYDEVAKLVAATHDPDGSGGVQQLIGHRGDDGNLYPYQDAAALTFNGVPTRKEHFGYDDGISDPYFEGCGQDPVYMIGGGKPAKTKNGQYVDPTKAEAWEPIEAGEFILGYRDESAELPLAPLPHDLAKNGSFMVYRKLHENVKSFNEYLDNMGKDYPDGREALSAKMVGRWKNGAPLATFPTEQEAKQFGDRYAAAFSKLGTGSSDEENSAYLQTFNELDKQLRAFNFNKDLEGGKCPMGSHIRRVNPRGALEFGNAEAYETPGALVDRRRILRRGLPYGKSDSDNATDNGNHGIIFMAVNASLKRQFEFVQQQWVNYGNDFKMANDRDPILGNNPVDPETGQGGGKMVVEGEKGKRAPFFCGNIPRFVETRGGAYFFIPSITSLQLISEGLVDPT